MNLPIHDPTGTVPVPSLEYAVAEMQRLRAENAELRSKSSMANRIARQGDDLAKQAATIARLTAALNDIANGEVMFKSFKEWTHAETVHEYQTIARAALADAVGGRSSQMKEGGK